MPELVAGSGITLTEDTGAGTLMVSGSGGVTPQQEGAVANNSTSDEPAFAALIAAAKARGLAGYDYRANLNVSYGTPGGRVFVPDTPLPYYIGAEIDVDATIYFQGEGVGNAGGVSSVLRGAAGKALIRVQFFNTDGYIGTHSPPAREVGGQGSVFDGLTAIGAGFNGTTILDNANASAFFLRGRASVRNTTIWNFQGDAVHIHAGIGLPEGGGANNWDVCFVWAQECLNGIYTNGSDTNAGVSIMFQASNMRDWAINDSSGAPNTYIAPLAQLCGTSGSGTANDPARATTHGGQRYICRDGQEAAASVTAPSGTTSDTTEWIWYETGGVVTGIPAWFSGIVVRSGGPYRLAFGGLIIGGYFEGSQPPPQLGTGGFMLGGSWGGNRRPVGGAYMNASSNQVFVNDLRVDNGGVTTADDVTGAILVGRYTPGGSFAFIRASATAAALSLTGPNGAVSVEIGNTYARMFDVANISTAFYPVTDNALSLGVSGLAWSEVWAHNATIQTSDRALKTAIRKLSGKEFDALLDAVGSVPIVAFKMKHAVEAKGAAARDHYGIVAQDLHDELVKRGLDPFAGGVLGRDKVMEDVEEKFPFEEDATRTEITFEDENEVVDGKVIRRSVPKSREVPDFDYLPVHDEDGEPIIIPAKPAGKRLAIGEDGAVTEIETPALPERPLTHPVRKKVKITKTRTVSKPKLDENGEQEWIWNVRYQEFNALRLAWMERTFKRAA